MSLGGRLKNSSVRIQYHTRYVKTKGTTIYGPYFFRWDLPGTYSIEEGILEITIVLRKQYSKAFPKDWIKTRGQNFFKTLEDLRASPQPLE